MRDVEAFFKMRCLACGVEGGVTEAPDDFGGMKMSIWTAPFIHECEDEPRVTGRAVVVAKRQFTLPMKPGDTCFQVRGARFWSDGTMAEVYVTTRILRWSDFPERAAKRCESLDVKVQGKRSAT